MRKKVESITNPILANLTKKTQSGFSSLAPRFNNQNTDEALAFIGPGYYEQKGQFDNTKGRDRQIISVKSQNFLSSAPRFTDALAK